MLSENVAVTVIGSIVPLAKESSEGVMAIPVKVAALTEMDKELVSPCLLAMAETEPVCNAVSKPVSEFIEAIVESETLQTTWLLKSCSVPSE